MAYKQFWGQDVCYRYLKLWLELVYRNMKCFQPIDTLRELIAFNKLKTPSSKPMLIHVFFENVTAHTGERGWYLHVYTYLLLDSEPLAL